MLTNLGGIASIIGILIGILALIIQQRKKFAFKIGTKLLDKELFKADQKIGDIKVIDSKKTTVKLGDIKQTFIQKIVFIPNWIWILLIILCLLALVYFELIYPEMLRKTLRFENEEVGILVCNFEGEGKTHEAEAQGILIADMIESRLNRAFNSEDFPIKAVSKKVPEVIKPFIETHKEAKELGNKFNADMVVWGQTTFITPSKISMSPSITLIKPIPFIKSKRDVERVQFYGLSREKLIEYDFQPLLTKDPLLMVNFIIGYIFQSHQNFKESIQHYEQAAKLADEYVSNRDVMHWYLGYAIYSSDLNDKNTKRSIQEFNYAISLNPENVDVLNELGIVYNITGKIDSAIMTLKNAIKINPNFTHAHNNLGWALKMKGLYKEAEKEYYKAIELDSLFLPAYFNLALLFEEIKNIDLAIENYQKALSIDPCEPEVLNNIGLLYYQKLGQLDSAKIYFERALKSDSTYAEIHSNLGLIYQYLGEYSKAEILLKKAQSMFKNQDYKFGVICYNIAALNSLQKNADEAFGWLRRGLPLLTDPIPELGGIIPIEYALEDPDLAFVRNDPRFFSLIDSVKSIAKY